MNKCRKCGNYLFNDGEICKCEPYQVYYPDYYGDEKQTVYGHSFEDVVQKTAEKINCDDPIFEEDIFETPVEITDLRGIKKLFNCSAVKEVYYSADEVVK